MPLYILLLADGLGRTRDLEKYYLRLGVIAGLSQIPFWLAGMRGVNAVYGLLVGAWIYKGGWEGMWIASTAWALGGWEFWIPAYGLGALRIGKEFAAGVFGIAAVATGNPFVALGGVVLLIAEKIPKLNIGQGQALYRWYYPGHLSVLAVGKTLL